MTDIKTAVYRLYGDGDVLLYVGVAVNPERRWRKHAADKSWWPQVVRREVEWHPKRLDAMQAEADAINAEGPKYNIAVPDPADPMTWPPASWYEQQAEGSRRARAAKAAAPKCPDCGQPLPPLMTCARPDCGETFYKRPGKSARAKYCSRRCARIVAQRALRKRQKAGA